MVTWGLGGNIDSSLHLWEANAVPHRSAETAAPLGFWLEVAPRELSQSNMKSPGRPVHIKCSVGVWIMKHLSKCSPLL